MGKIQSLPPELIKQIAAGEVIERPASVVKELVENAIDAGASWIEVEFEQGGSQCIRVRDNGSGIEAEDLPLALSTHATSKIRSWEDLCQLHSLGFRGEALASIAAVSRLSLSSRPAAQEHAYQIQSSGDIRPSAHDFGTTVEVRDLFYNTPARKRFLKSPRTERAHIIQLVQRLALSRENIRFVLREKGKVLGDYQGSREQRLQTLLGTEFMAQALAVVGEQDGMQLQAWLARPSFQASGEQHFIFLNGRIIRDRLIQSAMKAVYQDMLHGQRAAAYALWLTLPVEDFDANAHPNKFEVRFRQPQAVHQFIFHRLRPALRQHSMPRWEDYATPEALSPPAPAVRSAFSAPERSFASSLKSECLSPEKPAPLPAFRPADALPEPPLGRALAHIRGLFILAENRHGLVLVDMHAAHERIIFERLKDAWRESALPAQHLLLPEKLHLSPLEMDALERHQEALLRCGFRWQMQPDGIVLHAVPAFFARSGAAMLLAFLAELQELQISQHLNAQLEALLSRLACHRAVRAHDSLNLAEMNQLLRDLEATAAGNHCNHGRPTWVQLDEARLNQLFLRGQ